VTAIAPDVAAGYVRLDPGGGGAGVRGSCALVWVEGPDAASFLQGLLTNDVASLTPGGCVPALLLDAKGRIQVGLRCARDADDAFTLVTTPGAGGPLVALLGRYHVSEDLDVLGPEPSDLLTVGGLARPPASDAVDLALPGQVPGTWDLVVTDAGAALAALGLPQAPAESLTARRIEAGVPLVGVDTGPSTLVQEAGLENAAVSFDKGCYLGQETVARVAYRGHVNRRLRGLLLPAPAAPGARVESGGAAVGAVTSTAVSPARGPIALAMIRTSVADGEDVAVEGVPGPARVTGLPM